MPTLFAIEGIVHNPIAVFYPVAAVVNNFPTLAGCQEICVSAKASADYDAG
jgi:hypothetical protein